MHGGMKVYAGPPAAARAYLEADRGRADDYYLAESTGLARRFTATVGRVVQRAPLTGETYETLVAGRRPACRHRSRLRRSPGPRRYRDHRLAGRARHHPGRAARRAGAGAARS